MLNKSIRKISYFQSSILNQLKTQRHSLILNDRKY